MRNSDEMEEAWDAFTGRVLRLTKKCDVIRSTGVLDVDLPEAEQQLPTCPGEIGASTFRPQTTSIRVPDTRTVDVKANGGRAASFFCKFATPASAGGDN